MNNWNDLLRQSVNEFKTKRTVNIPVRAPKRQRKDLILRIGFGVLVNMGLFLIWLVNRDAQHYLILSALWSILYGCHMAQKVSQS